jgi:hypothetical protein
MILVKCPEEDLVAQARRLEEQSLPYIVQRKVQITRKTVDQIDDQTHAQIVRKIV